MEVYQKSRGGFDFGLCDRNVKLAQEQGAKLPKTKKTGTTICGIVYKNGVVLGADTRATEGPIVCDKNCEKIHKISEKIWCCGAGTSADTENVTGLIGSQMELHRLATGKEPRVITALTRLKQRLFQYQGYVSAALVLGGVDSEGGHIYTVWPHGSTDRLPYATMGSGSLAAMAIFEAGYKDDLDEKEAIDLVDQAIQAGIWNDLGSGGNVDIMVLDKKAAPKMLRNYKKLNERTFHAPGLYKFPKGTTALAEEAKKRFASMTVEAVDSKMETE
uniref:Proteasome subunit beta n=1 Tax=Lotharella oceanica TaxID=641309 RepID=A0A7S2XDS8_9EUKA|mmetsp:Transcript_32187/g.59943  ORF Transcript_32187/g.59943 Transcript_32187/m.59943 type:complete len:274 (+) Transcript_32187:22-843(+)|eukprot:CAMPEP_0170178030 /NCGR_PEP_ID=MMETSP0040_2-20121228/11624_1 /TAXON_ID=641309 /ORGANISM="Lotharella oceanica, Strain CCMP622" /LENGTH=273 /DNA_ID=CAMNT_0010420979 /DNA_START=23 /DNA_END=844 /DNA_ORIENTATION=+